MKKHIFIASLVFLLSFEVAKAQRLSSPDTLVVKVVGTGTDARFVPALVEVGQGDVIRFEILEGMHTVTAYHPKNRRPLRIPQSAASFDSGMLSEGDIWFLKIKVEGIYDYFCMPHERLGHVGRIIAGSKITAIEFDNSIIPEKAAQIFESL